MNYEQIEWMKPWSKVTMFEWAAKTEAVQLRCPAGVRWFIRKEKNNNNNNNSVCEDHHQRPSDDACSCIERLEALPVDDGRAGFVVLLLADPHGLEGGQRGQDGATDPDGVLPLRRSNDLDLHRARRHRRDLLLHAVGNTREHGRAAGHDRVGV